MHIDLYPMANAQAWSVMLWSWNGPARVSDQLIDGWCVTSTIRSAAGGGAAGPCCARELGILRGPAVPSIQNNSGLPQGPAGASGAS